MAIKALARRGVSNREVARQLGVTEGTVRYHLRRQAVQAVDGRADRAPAAARFGEAIAQYLQARQETVPTNVADLHAWLVAEHDCQASLRALQRYVRRIFAPPPVRARRRVETPPGAQAQADWAHFPGVRMDGTPRGLTVLGHAIADFIDVAGWDAPVHDP